MSQHKSGVLCRALDMVHDQCGPPKVDPNTGTVKRNANLIWQYKRYANFRDKPIFRSDKTSYTTVNGDKWKCTYPVSEEFFPGLQALTQGKSDKYIFIYHCLTVVLSLRKRKLLRKFVYVLYCHIKFAFLSTVYMFRSRFRTIAVILVPDFPPHWKWVRGFKPWSKGAGAGGGGWGGWGYRGPFQLSWINGLCRPVSFLWPSLLNKTFDLNVISCTV